MLSRFPLRCHSKVCTQIFKEKNYIATQKISGNVSTSREAAEKVDNVLKTFRFLAWLNHFVLPRNSKSQFGYHDQEEQGQPLGELDR